MKARKPVDVIVGPLTRLGQRKQTKVDKAMLTAVRRLSYKESTKALKTQPRTSQAHSRPITATQARRIMQENNLCVLAAVESLLREIRAIICGR